ncbi:hypothetical protein M758_3G105200 [Ceratodon purpureus]|nr:hypothetical protein M758_3G105200 [Ceratodon purpureus]
MTSHCPSLQFLYIWATQVTAMGNTNNRQPKCPKSLKDNKKISANVCPQQPVRTEISLQIYMNALHSLYKIRCTPISSNNHSSSLRSPHRSFDKFDGHKSSLQTEI